MTLHTAVVPTLEFFLAWATALWQWLATLDRWVEFSDAARTVHRLYRNPLAWLTIA